MKGPVHLLLFSALLCGFSSSAAASPQSAVLIIDQSNYALRASPEISDIIRNTLINATPHHFSIYEAKLELGLYQDAAYDERLIALLKERYRGVRLGAIVALGAKSLDYAISIRKDDREDVPIVFAAIAEAAVDRETLPRNVYGRLVPSSLTSIVSAARVLVPDLQTIVLVGDPLHVQPYRSNYAREVSNLRTAQHVIDLTGLPLSDLRESIAVLPEGSAIAYTGINIDRNLEVYSPRAALQRLSAISNRPIIVDIETYLDSGAAGGFVLRPDIVGREAAELVLRILRGETVSALTNSAALQPVFDWRQLQRWKINESQLPPGSDIRHRENTFFEKYYWHITGNWAASIALLALFIALLIEDRNRRKAQQAAIELRTQLSHIDRAAVAGELSATIAHEVRQPLTSILGHGAACIHWLDAKTPNLEEARSALKKLINEGHRANQILEATRSLFKSDHREKRYVNVNTLTRNILSLLVPELNKLGIQLQLDLHRSPRPLVKGIEVQLQQVILNLIMNAIDALKLVPQEERKMAIRIAAANNEVVITITDSGLGIDKKIRDSIFQSFFTTKTHGMGMGLSVCRSIILAHEGKLDLIESPHRGASFQILLPYKGAVP